MNGVFISSLFTPYGGEPEVLMFGVMKGLQ